MNIAKTTATCSAAVLGSLFCLAAPAAAGEPWLELLTAKPGEEVSARVDIADLDLTERAGKRQLQIRLRTAASLVCAKSAFANSERAYPPYLSPQAACKVDTLANAGAAINILVDRAIRGERAAALDILAQGQAR